MATHSDPAIANNDSTAETPDVEVASDAEAPANAAEGAAANQDQD